MTNFSHSSLLTCDCCRRDRIWRHDHVVSDRLHEAGRVGAVVDRPAQLLAALGAVERRVCAGRRFVERRQRRGAVVSQRCGNVMLLLLLVGGGCGGRSQQLTLRLVIVELARARVQLELVGGVGGVARVEQARPGQQVERQRARQGGCGGGGCGGRRREGRVQLGPTRVPLNVAVEWGANWSCGRRRARLSVRR